MSIVIQHNPSPFLTGPAAWLAQKQAQQAAGSMQSQAQMANFMGAGVGQGMQLASTAYQNQQQNQRLDSQQAFQVKQWDAAQALESQRAQQHAALVQQQMAAHMAEKGFTLGYTPEQELQQQKIANGYGQAMADPKLIGPSPDFSKRDELTAHYMDEMNRWSQKTWIKQPPPPPPPINEVIQNGSQILEKPEYGIVYTFDPKTQQYKVNRMNVPKDESAKNLPPEPTAKDLQPFMKTALDMLRGEKNLNPSAADVLHQAQQLYVGAHAAVHGQYGNMALPPSMNPNGMTLGPGAGPIATAPPMPTTPLPPIQMQQPPESGAPSQSEVAPGDVQGMIDQLAQDDMAAQWFQNPAQAANLAAPAKQTIEQIAHAFKGKKMPPDVERAYNEAMDTYVKAMAYLKHSGGT